MGTAKATFLSDLPTVLYQYQPSSRTKTDTFSSHQTLALRPRSPWLGSTSLSLHSSSLTPPLMKPRLVATIFLSLPTANPAIGSSSSEKVPKWSWRAIKSFAMGKVEARKLKLPDTGTEGILMGILNEGTSLASKFLRANGIMLLKVREEVLRLRGKPDLFFFSPEHPPLTEEAQRAIDSAIDKMIKSGDNGEIPTSYLLLGIWSEVESPGHKILATFGFNDDKVKDLESLLSKPGFDDD